MVLIQLYDFEVYFALLDFFERDARGFMLERVNVYPRSRAALELFTSFRRDDNQTILGIHYGLSALYLNVAQLLRFGFSHDASDLHRRPRMSNVNYESG